MEQDGRKSGMMRGVRVGRPGATQAGSGRGGTRRGAYKRVNGARGAYTAQTEQAPCGLPEWARRAQNAEGRTESRENQKRAARQLHYVIVIAVIAVVYAPRAPSATVVPHAHRPPPTSQTRTPLLSILDARRGKNT